MWQIDFLSSGNSDHKSESLKKAPVLAPPSVLFHKCIHLKAQVGEEAEIDQ